MRVTFKKVLLSLCIVIVILIVSTSFVSSKTIIKMGTGCTVEDPLTKSFQMIKEKVEEESQGEIELQIFPDAQLGNALTEIEGVQMGTIDIYAGGIGWAAQFVKDFNILATAFVMKDNEHTDKVIESDIGKELAEKLKEGYGMLLIDAQWHRNPRQFVSVNKEVHSVEDIKGLAMRVPDLPSYTLPWQLLGAKTIAMSQSEVYLAMQQGIIEAWEGTLVALKNRSLEEVADYLVLTNHSYENAMILMNENTFNSLSPENQEIFLDAIHLGREHNNELMKAAEQEYLEKIKATGEMTIIVPDDSFRKKLSEAAPILEEEGLWSKGLYERVQSLEEE